MSDEIITIIVSSIVAAVAAPIGAWVNSKVLKKKYNLEIGSMRAALEKELSDVRKSELENVREASDILMNDIVKPLKVEIQSLRKDVNKFRKAIEKIPGCPAAADCPVSLQLRLDEAGPGDQDSDK